jgi:ankyrin repeat protein
VQQLLEKGTGVEAKDTDGEMALYLAASRGNKVVDQLLLERDAKFSPLLFPPTSRV